MAGEGEESYHISICQRAFPTGLDTSIQKDSSQEIQQHKLRELTSTSPQRRNGVDSLHPLRTAIAKLALLLAMAISSNPET